MPEARQDAAEPRRDRTAEPQPDATPDAFPLAAHATAPGPPTTPAAVLWLQSVAGNQAVTRNLARSSILQREPAAPGVDVGAEARNVTVTMVLRNFNLPKSGDASTIDFLHEPGISIQISPKQAPEPVLQAALSAMNLHLQRHGKDLVEISVGPQASAGGGEKPSVGAQAQAQIHVSTTFSITAATSVAAAAPGEESKPGTKVDITWSPMSIGVLYKLGEKDPAREKGEGSEFYKALTPGKDVISWVTGQLDPAEFAAPGKEGLHVNKLVTDMFDAMLAARGDEAQLNVDLALMHEPPGLDRGLARAGQLLASARPDFARLRSVRLAILKLPPDGKGPSRAQRWKQLPLQGDAVAPASGTPAPAGPDATPPVRTWGTGPPVSAADGAAPAVDTGPTALGQSRVLPAPPPMRGLPAQGQGAGGP